MKVLVTGASGYLGTGVIKSLCDDGVEVIAACLANPELVDSRAKRLECDIFSIEDPYEFFGQPNAVLHMAWRNGFEHNNSSHIFDFSRHYLFIEKMVRGGCRQIAVMGTMHEVGFFEGSIKEDTPTHPESLYGIGKDALRNTTKLLCKETGTVFQWLRGFYIVGNSESGSSIFSKIVKAEKAGQERFPFTMGQNQWDFVDYDAFCRMTAAAVEQNEVNGVINICSGRPEKLADRVERFITENHFQIQLEYGKFPDRPYDSKAVWGDDSKINRIMSNWENLRNK